MVLDNAQQQEMLIKIIDSTQIHSTFHEAQKIIEVISRLRNDVATAAISGVNNNATFNA
jgi:hypothetical protein